jgi:hypothetical protein
MENRPDNRPDHVQSGSYSLKSLPINKWGTFVSSSPTACGGFSTHGHGRFSPAWEATDSRQAATRMVPVLNCRACGALASAARFRYLCERLIYDYCGAENSQTRVCAFQTRDIFVPFTTGIGSALCDRSRHRW